MTFKKGRGPYVPYGDIRDEALCFGWIDSRPAKLDAERTMVMVSPRRAGSGWSAINKARIAMLIDAGLMAGPGLAKIAAAEADGSWTRLDTIESVPADLRAALDRNAEAARQYMYFAPSARRGIQEWIAAAKRPDTRSRRIDETVRPAEHGLKANFPRSPR